MRRKLLLLATLAIAVAGLPSVAASAGPTRPDQKIVLRAVATGAGTYLYLPFDVPGGVNRVAVNMDEGQGGRAAIGIGLFDQRGAGYDSPGFRGLYGEEKNDFFVSADDASRAFLPGRIDPGRWTVIVPVFTTTVPRQLTITVTLSFGRQAPSAHAGPEQGVVLDRPGWYRGDLHDHTTESSDAFASRSARSPSEYPAAIRQAGLDWVSLTDHDVISQNRHLAENAAGEGVLTMGGEEMTNFFHGHATVTGLSPGTFIDWRQRPRGIPLMANEERIDRFIADVRSRPVYVSVAHPFGANLSWQFFADGAADPSLLPEGLEVWNGAFQPDDEATLRKWDQQLRQGLRTVANGGSDVHGFEQRSGLSLGVGRPTTVTYADQLSTRAVVSALQRGRSFITSSPTGPELYLTGRGPGGQAQIVGGTIYGTPLDVARLSVLVRGGSGRTLTFLRDGAPIQTTPVTHDDQTVDLDQSIGLGGYVRVELRGPPSPASGQPEASSDGMQALTNPIFLVNGPAPPGLRPEIVPPPARPVGQSRLSRAPRALRFSVHPSAVRAGSRTRFRFRVTALEVAADRAGRPERYLPVREARVTFAGSTHTTDSRGEVTFVERFHAPGSRIVRATKLGFRSTEARISVRARSVARRGHGRPRFTG